MKQYSLAMLIFLTGCVQYKTPQLPAFDTPSFSYDEVMQQKQRLQQHLDNARKSAELEKA